MPNVLKIAGNLGFIALFCTVRGAVDAPVAVAAFLGVAAGFRSFDATFVVVDATSRSGWRIALVLLTVDVAREDAVVGLLAADAVVDIAGRVVDDARSVPLPKDTVFSPSVRRSVDVDRIMLKCYTTSQM
jgi:hypothetical protein